MASASPGSSPWPGRSRNARAAAKRVGPRQRRHVLQQRVNKLAAAEPVGPGAPLGQRRGGFGHRTQLGVRRPAWGQRLGPVRLLGRRRGRPAGGTARPRRQRGRNRRPAGPCPLRRGKLRRGQPQRLALPRREGLARHITECGKALGHQAVPARLRQRPPRSASRRPPAGPRPGSARHRAGGCAPPAAGRRLRRAAGRAAAQRSSLRGDHSGTCALRGGIVGPQDRCRRRAAARWCRAGSPAAPAAPWRRAPS